jgi:serine/threonine protein kinase
MDKAKLNLLQYLCSYEKLDMPFDQVVQLLYDLLNVLNYLAEKGIMHRDIKPENVMLSLNASKEIEKCFLIDFGFAAF